MALKKTMEERLINLSKPGGTEGQDIREGADSLGYYERECEEEHHGFYVG